MALLLSLRGALGAQEGGDLQAQILYAYQTEDPMSSSIWCRPRQSSQIGRRGRGASLSPGARASTASGCSPSDSGRKAAAPAFADCVDQLKPMLDQDAKSVEALALQSACYAQLAKYRHLEAVLLRSRAEERLNAPSRSRRAIRACCISPPWKVWRLEARLGARTTGIRAICLRLRSCSTKPPPPATMCRAGATRRPISRSACSCRRGRCARCAQLDREVPARRARLQGGAEANGEAGPALAGARPPLRVEPGIIRSAMKPQGTQLSLFETRSPGDPFAVRVSARARRLTARVHVGGRVEIVVPVGVNARAVRDFVQRFTPWIDRKVAAMQCFAEPAARVPGRIEFAYTGERFEVRVASKPRGARSTLEAAGSRCARRTPTRRGSKLQGLAQAGRPRAAGAAAAEARAAI